MNLLNSRVTAHIFIVIILYFIWLPLSSYLEDFELECLEFDFQNS